MKILLSMCFALVGLMDFSLAESTPSNKGLITLPTGTTMNVMWAQIFQGYTASTSANSYLMKLQGSSGAPVYSTYAADKPGWDLFSNQDLSQPAPITTAKFARTTQPVSVMTENPGAMEQPAPRALGEAVMRSATECNRAVHFETCSPQASAGSSDVRPPFTEVAKSVDVPATGLQQDLNSYGPWPRKCFAGGVDEVQYCGFLDEKDPSSFALRDEGGTVAVPGLLNPQRTRTWEFSFPGHARQDLGVYISDNPDSEKQTQETYLMFFPRDKTPSVHKEGDQLVVTLANGEKVLFDSKSKAVKGGVLAETGAMTAGGKTLQPAKIEYSGSGVMIRADSLAKDPQRGGNAVIMKGGKTCSVAKSLLWPDQSTDSALHFRFATDGEFMKFLSQKCPQFN